MRGVAWAAERWLGWLYFCFAEPGADGEGNATALARAVLAPDATRLQEVQVIFRQRPRHEGRLHFGYRIVEAPDGCCGCCQRPDRLTDHTRRCAYTWWTCPEMS